MRRRAITLLGSRNSARAAGDNEIKITMHVRFKSKVVRTQSA